MAFWERFKRGKQGAVKGAKKNKAERPKLGLCLGGGGARGFAHIGALRAFEEAGIDFDLCVGTSAGSIIGALYCAGIESDEMQKYGASLNMKEVHNGIILTPNDPMKIARIVTNLIGDAQTEHLKKKFAAVAVDLAEGRQVVLDRGKVGEAVAASSAVPLFFRPVAHGGTNLVDGGLLNNIPADVCRMLGADKVVTVDINPTRGGGTRETGLIDVIKATFSIMSANSSVTGLRLSDVVIAPDLSAFKATSKDGYEQMIELGYRAAKDKIALIRALMS